MHFQWRIGTRDFSCGVKNRRSLACSRNTKRDFVALYPRAQSALRTPQAWTDLLFISVECLADAPT